MDLSALGTGALALRISDSREGGSLVSEGTLSAGVAGGCKSNADKVTAKVRNNKARLVFKTEHWQKSVKINAGFSKRRAGIVAPSVGQEILFQLAANAEAFLQVEDCVMKDSTD